MSKTNNNNSKHEYFGFAVFNKDLKDFSKNVDTSKDNNNNKKTKATAFEYKDFKQPETVETQKNTNNAAAAELGSFSVENQNVFRDCSQGTFGNRILLNDKKVLKSFGKWDNLPKASGAEVNAADIEAGKASAVTRHCKIEVGGAQAQVESVFLNTDYTQTHRDIRKVAPNSSIRPLERATNVFMLAPRPRDEIERVLRQLAEDAAPRHLWDASAGASQNGKELLTIKIFDSQSSFEEVRPVLEIIQELRAEGYPIGVEIGIPYSYGKTSAINSITGKEEGSGFYKDGKLDINDDAYPDEYYIRKFTQAAKMLQEYGIPQDKARVSLKDMVGELSAERAKTLIPNILKSLRKDNLFVPFGMHCHDTGLATEAYAEGIIACKKEGWPIAVDTVESNRSYQKYLEDTLNREVAFLEKFFGICNDGQKETLAQTLGINEQILKKGFVSIKQAIVEKYGASLDENESKEDEFQYEGQPLSIERLEAVLAKFNLKDQLKPTNLKNHFNKNQQALLGQIDVTPESWKETGFTSLRSVDHAIKRRNGGIDVLQLGKSREKLEEIGALIDEVTKENEVKRAKASLTGQELRDFKIPGGGFASYVTAVEGAGIANALKISKKQALQLGGYALIAVGRLMGQPFAVTPGFQNRQIAALNLLKNMMDEKNPLHTGAGAAKGSGLSKDLTFEQMKAFILNPLEKKQITQYFLRGIIDPEQIGEAEDLEKVNLEKIIPANKNGDKLINFMRGLEMPRDVHPYVLKSIGGKRKEILIDVKGKDGKPIVKSILDDLKKTVEELQKEGYVEPTSLQVEYAKSLLFPDVTNENKETTNWKKELAKSLKMQPQVYAINLIDSKESDQTFLRLEERFGKNSYIIREAKNLRTQKEEQGNDFDRDKAIKDLTTKIFANALAFHSTTARGVILGNPHELREKITKKWLRERLPKEYQGRPDEYKRMLLRFGKGMSAEPDILERARNMLLKHYDPKIVDQAVNDNNDNQNKGAGRAQVSMALARAIKAQRIDPSLRKEAAEIKQSTLQHMRKNKDTLQAVLDQLTHSKNKKVEAGSRIGVSQKCYEAIEAFYNQQKQLANVSLNTKGIASLYPAKQRATMALDYFASEIAKFSEDKNITELAKQIIRQIQGDIERSVVDAHVGGKITKISDVIKSQAGKSDKDSNQNDKSGTQTVRIKEGSLLYVIEAMKQFHEIRAPLVSVTKAGSFDVQAEKLFNAFKDSKPSDSKTTIQKLLENKLDLEFEDLNTLKASLNKQFNNDNQTKESEDKVYGLLEQFLKNNKGEKLTNALKEFDLIKTYQNEHIYIDITIPKQLNIEDFVSKGTILAKLSEKGKEYEKVTAGEAIDEEKLQTLKSTEKEIEAVIKEQDKILAGKIDPTKFQKAANDNNKPKHKRYTKNQDQGYHAVDLGFSNDVKKGNKGKYVNIVLNRAGCATKLIGDLTQAGHDDVRILYTEGDKSTPIVRYTDDKHKHQIEEYADKRNGQVTQEVIDYLKKVAAEAKKQGKKVLLHPGWGFISENANSAGIINALDNVIFVGPGKSIMAASGDKLAFRDRVNDVEDGKYQKFNPPYYGNYRASSAQLQDYLDIRSGKKIASDEPLNENENKNENESKDSEAGASKRASINKAKYGDMHIALQNEFVKTLLMGGDVRFKACLGGGGRGQKHIVIPEEVVESFRNQVAREVFPDLELDKLKKDKAQEALKKAFEGLGSKQAIDVAFGKLKPETFKQIFDKTSVVEQFDNYVKEAQKITEASESLFGDDKLMTERNISRKAHHIEAQLIATAGGAVNLGFRNCTLQNNGQKIAEINLVEGDYDPDLIDEINRAVKAFGDNLAKGGYVGAGTLEMMVMPGAPEGQRVRVLEVNTRIQVEHGVTEEDIFLKTGKRFSIPALNAALADNDTLDKDDPNRKNVYQIIEDMFGLTKEDVEKLYKPGKNRVTHFRLNSKNVDLLNGNAEGSGTPGYFYDWMWLNQDLIAEIAKAHNVTILQGGIGDGTKDPQMGALLGKEEDVLAALEALLELFRMSRVFDRSEDKPNLEVLQQLYKAMFRPKNEVPKDVNAIGNMSKEFHIGTVDALLKDIYQSNLRGDGRISITKEAPAGEVVYPGQVFERDLALIEYVNPNDPRVTGRANIQSAVNDNSQNKNQNLEIEEIIDTSKEQQHQ